MLDLLESFANHNRFTYVRLDGTVKVDRRQALVDSFNSDPRGTMADFCLFHPRALAVWA
ncbi:unnamed protein product [Prorocentrum cordatum]|uniref:Uncharacterized protein n=1 Tax=Prorocentrum cordatum TaxID=2364126 RepID=A0ABN9R915_9DINO|nr:unnamed protein product [Polarella glacialis]